MMVPKLEEVMWHGVKQRYVGLSIKDLNQAVTPYTDGKRRKNDENKRYYRLFNSDDVFVSGDAFDGPHGCWRYEDQHVHSR